MRILIVSQYFWPESFRINDVARDLVRRGHEVTVLCGTPNYPRGRAFEGFGWFRRTRETWNGVDIVRVPSVTRGAGSRVRLALNYLSYAVSASLFGPLRCKGGYDTILTYQLSPATMGIPGVVMKRLKKAPIVHWVQDLWPESIFAVGAVRAGWLLRPVDRMVRWLYRSSAIVAIQSKSFRQHVESRGIDATRIRYLPNAAEDFYRPLPEKDAHPALSSVPAGFRVMFAGNIGSVQDLPTVLNAAELTRVRPDILWIIVGDGSMRQWVETEVERRGLRSTVYLLGQFPVQDMPRMFAGADALLVTLRRDPVLAMTIPSKVQSYLASGKPIVGALDGEGAAVIAEAGAGVCASPEDAQALARHVIEMSDLEQSRRQDMGCRGREYFLANFATDMVQGRLESWCAELVASGAGR